MAVADSARGRGGSGDSLDSGLCLWFSQIIASKDATIEQLKDRIERLKAETAPSVILEKKALIDEIESRARQKVKDEEAPFRRDWMRGSAR